MSSWLCPEPRTFSFFLWAAWPMCLASLRIMWAHEIVFKGVKWCCSRRRATTWKCPKTSSHCRADPGSQCGFVLSTFQTYPLCIWCWQWVPFGKHLCLPLMPFTKTSLNTVFTGLWWHLLIQIYFFLDLVPFALFPSRSKANIINIGKLIVTWGVQF